MDAGRFYGGTFALTGDWLQANALPLTRSAAHSMAFGVSYRRTRWEADAGYLRIARDLSTVQGGQLSGGPVAAWNRFTFRPFAGVFAGEALASADTTGYDFVGSGGVVGHQPRYSYSTGATFGGGVGLTVEAALYGPLAARATAAQWYFSGAPMAVERGRTLLGAGLSWRAW
jgi:hypothetical protein